VSNSAAGGMRRGAVTRGGPFGVAPSSSSCTSRSCSSLPLCVVVAGSLKSFEEVTTSSIWAWPSQPSLEAFTDSLQPPLVNSGGIASGLVNSLVMTIPAVIVSALWGSVTGYALSMWRFRGSELLFALILFGLFIPYQAILIPLLTTLQLLRLFDSLAGLALTHIIFGLPITTLIFRNFYAAIPKLMMPLASMARLLAGVSAIVLPLSVPRLRRRGHLAVHQHLERIPVRGLTHQLTGHAAGHGLAAESPAASPPSTTCSWRRAHRRCADAARASCWAASSFEACWPVP
jgi:hypothetical protein